MRIKESRHSLRRQCETTSPKTVSQRQLAPESGGEVDTENVDLRVFEGKLPGGCEKKTQGRTRCELAFAHEDACTSIHQAMLSERCATTTGAELPFAESCLITKPRRPTQLRSACLRGAAAGSIYIQGCLSSNEIERDAVEQGSNHVGARRRDPT